jgi:putative ABC transport system ATP-binding protein
MSPTGRPEGEYRSAQREGSPASAMPFIHLTGVAKSYRRGRVIVPVLQGLDLDVEAGGFVALTGPSGSGKSTLLNLIAGLDRPDHGQVVVGGQDLARMGELARTRWRARHVGFVFQFYNLIPVLSAVENVALALLVGAAPAALRQRRALAALDDVGLSHRARHFPDELSGGEQQRVAIARALVNDPPLVVADEPTGDLDDRSADEALALLRRCHDGRGTTLLMVTHDARAAAVATSRIRLAKDRLDSAQPERKSLPCSSPA